MLAAVAIVFHSASRAYAATRSGTARDPACTARLTVLTGAVLGVLVSISSVGAGALGVTALFFLCRRAGATASSARTSPTRAADCRGRYRSHGCWAASTGCCLAAHDHRSLPGIWLGSHISDKVPTACCARFWRPGAGRRKLMARTGRKNDHSEGMNMYRYDTADTTSACWMSASRNSRPDAPLFRRRTRPKKFLPLRLQNGIYIQRRTDAAPRSPTATCAPTRCACGRPPRTYDRGYGHFTTRHNVQFNW